MVEKLGLHPWGPPSWVSGNATPQPRRCTASEGRVALRLLQEVLLEKKGGPRGNRLSSVAHTTIRLDNGSRCNAISVKACGKYIRFILCKIF